MKNYERYKDITSESYDKKSAMSYVCRVPADRKLKPILSQIKDKAVLEVGIGTGYYTRLFLQNNNTVTGIDQNPGLCPLDVEVIAGDAADLSALTAGRRFDVVFSGWMTEYLSPVQLKDFFKASRDVLADNGQLITTVISPYAIGYAYVTLARRIRNIEKYTYHWKDIQLMLSELGYSHIERVHLRSWLGISWAYLVIAS